MGNFTFSKTDTIYYKAAVIETYTIKQCTSADFNNDSWNDIAYTRGIGVEMPNLCILYNDGTGRILGESLPTSIPIEPSLLKDNLTCFPNPFTTETTIQLEIQNTETVSLYISDITGRVVNQLLNHKKLVSGQYKFTWTPESELPRGNYIVNLSTSKTSTTRKVIKL